MPVQRYIMIQYEDGQAIGKADLTPEQFDLYNTWVQRPNGMIALGAMPRGCNYDLDPPFQNEPSETRVYLDGPVK